MEGGREQNYWPGFVDALSNVVLTLVFVLVVFVFALVMASSKVSKKMQEVTQAEQAQKEGQAQLDHALAELEQLRTEEKSAAQSGANKPGTQDQPSCLKFSKSDGNQHADIAAGGASMLITFSPTAISVTEESLLVIHNFINAIKLKNPNAKFTIESSEDPASISPLLSRETQLGRILNTRNALLGSQVPPGGIIIQNTVPLQQNGTYNWVKINAQ